MADISKITLPSNDEYNIKDATARQGLTGKQDTITVNGILQGDGSGNITAAASSTADTLNNPTTNGTYVLQNTVSSGSSTLSWGTGGDSLPSQSGNSGKFLTTNGTTASWATVDADSINAVPKTVSTAGGNISSTITNAITNSTPTIIFRTDDSWDYNQIEITPTSTVIHKVPTPTADGDAANKKYVDDAIPDISGKIDTAGTGLSKSGTTLNHSNSVTAQTISAVYPIKIDAQGHISEYGSAVTIPDGLPSQTGNSGKFLTTDGTDASWATVIQDDHKWNDVALNKTSKSGYGGFVPYVDENTSTTAGLKMATTSPTKEAVALWDGNKYLYSTTPTSSDNSTKVATTAYVTTAISGISIPEASTTTPSMDGTASYGSGTTWARADHVHPTDTSRAASSHSHGDITNSGDITASAPIITTGDQLIINDESASKITNSGITFDTNVTTAFLRRDGTWAVPSEVFIATYGTTTNAQILTAYNAGKLCYAYLSSEGKIYYPLVYNYANQTFGFTIQNGTGREKTLWCDSTGWSDTYRDIIASKLYTATCSTAAATAAKIATLDDDTKFELSEGVRVAVRFKYGNSATSPTLRVDGSNIGTGTAKDIVFPFGEASTTLGKGDTVNTWSPYETIIFTYNGTYWVNSGSGLGIYRAYNLASGAIQAPSSPSAGNVLTYDTTNGWVASAPSGGLPDQTGNSGKYLTTNGTAASWGATSATSTKSIDSAPTSSSSNLVTSGGVYTAINNKVNRTTAVNAADTNYTTLMARGVKLLDATTFDAVSNWSSELVNGAIAWRYE